MGIKQQSKGTQSQGTRRLIVEKLEHTFGEQEEYERHLGSWQIQLRNRDMCQNWGEKGDALLRNQRRRWGISRNSEFIQETSRYSAGSGLQQRIQLGSWLFARWEAGDTVRHLGQMTLQCTMYCTLLQKIASRN